jgi:small subunit ribosomal protein S11
MAKTSKTTRKRTVKVESIGEAHINATFNNIIISLTNLKGELFHGPLLGRWASEAPKRIHLMQLRLLHWIAQKLPMTKVFGK